MNHISPLVPSVVFRGDAEHRLRHAYIDVVVKSFFDARGIDVPREVDASSVITDIDFKQSWDLQFKYFYNVVMKGVRKVDGKISNTCFALTFDPDMCPHTCSKTGVKYGYMSLAGHPVFYYVLLDLVELIRVLRQHSDLKPVYGKR